MTTYLFIWNPKKDFWDSLEDDVETLRNVGSITLSWSSGSRKYMDDGDRFFFVKLGPEDPKGVMGCGSIVGNTFEGIHWSGEDKSGNFAHLKFDVLLNPYDVPIMDLKGLNSPILKLQPTWTPQSSGYKLLPEVAVELEQKWQAFLAKSLAYKLPDLKYFTQAYDEGTPLEVISKMYERSPKARELCLSIHGYSCVVCGFNFEKTYGEIGRGIIEVHHLDPLGLVRKKHSVNPKKDMRPVCANCHTMIHSRRNPYTPAELQKTLRRYSPLAKKVSS